MQVGQLLRIAGIGVLVTVIVQILNRAGREDMAMLTTVAGLVIVLSLVVSLVAELFASVQSIFGLPEAVLGQGITRESGGIDDLMASFFYADGPVVNLESSWCRGPFDATLAAICENGTYEITGQTVTTYHRDGTSETLDFAKEKNGYFREIAYFASCVAAGREPEFCSLESVRRSMKLAFTEERSARCGRKLRVRA